MAHQSKEGSVHVEVGYGPNPDPDHPQRTRVAYYSIGRLTQPALDWPMLERVLDAVIIALDSPTAHDHETHKQATAALHALKQAGFLQACSPDRLFNEFGAWPRLLPRLITDERWHLLFASLHGAEAARRYRQQARAWVEYAERTMARLLEQNNTLRELVQAAQRQGPAGRGPHGGDIRSATLPAATASPPATRASGVTHIASVADESLTSRQPPRVTPPASATPVDRSHGNAVKSHQYDAKTESLGANQLILRSRSCENIDQKRISPASAMVEGESPRYSRVGDSINPIIEAISVADDAIPPIEPHLRDGELTTKRLDNTFWVEVNFIL